MVGMVSLSALFPNTTTLDVHNPSNQGSKLYQDKNGDRAGDLRVICVSLSVGWCFGVC